MSKKSKFRITKTMLSDTNKLEEKLKRPYFKEFVTSVIENIVEKEVAPINIDRQISEALGSNVGRVIRFVLDLDSEGLFEFTSALLEAGAPKESVDFINELASKYGHFFTDYRDYARFPKAVDGVAGSGYYTTSEDLVLRIRLIRKGDAFIIEAPAYSIFDLTKKLLKLIQVVYEDLKKDIPGVKLEISKKDFKKMKKQVQELESVVTK